MDKVGAYKFLAEPFHCDFSQRLFMGHLGNHMLNAADFHSNDRGFGMKYLLSVNRAWVLSRLAIEMDEMPEMYTTFTVETWVESAMRYFTNRNFRVVGENGKVYGYGRSIWAMIDTETRQPCSLMDIHDGDLMNWVEKDKVNPMDRLSRVKMDERAEFVRTIDTQYNDVDTVSILPTWLRLIREISCRSTRSRLPITSSASVFVRIMMWSAVVVRSSSYPNKKKTSDLFCVPHVFA